MDSILTVTAAATPPGFDLTTIADVKVDLGISGSASDTLLQRYVTECSIAIAGECGRVFAKETVSELYRFWQARDRLILRRWPVVSIDSVDDFGAALTAADWEVDKEKGFLFRLSLDTRTSWRSEKITVVYQAGYVLPGSAPADLQRLARECVKAQWLAKSRDPLVKSIEIDEIGRKDFWIGALPADESAFASDVIARHSEGRSP